MLFPFSEMTRVRLERIPEHLRRKAESSGRIRAGTEPRQKQRQRLGSKSEQEMKFMTNRNRDKAKK
jgi:hypothetical protein